jgi:Ni/Co efflux regulator RcnB
MKKFITAALAAAVATTSIAATPAMAAPFQRNDHHVTVVKVDHRGDHRQAVQYRGWKKGDRFNQRQARNYRVISNPRAYHFRDAPRGYRWVQSGNDAVLIGITSGLVASVLAGAFH